MPRGGIGGIGSKHLGGIGVGNDLVALVALFDSPFHAACKGACSKNDVCTVCGGIVLYAQIIRIVFGGADSLICSVIFDR